MQVEKGPQQAGKTRSPKDGKKKGTEVQGKEEQNLITFKSLQEGEQFDKDIRRIMGIIGNVEKEFGEQKINKNFKRAVNNAY
jgi:hypothetical protein